jgi:guanylate kinase
MKDKLIVEERMKEFNKDVLHWKNYDYVVVNDELENCFNIISSFIEKEINNSKTDYNEKLIAEHVKKLIS